MNKERAMIGLRYAAALREELEALAAIHHCSVNQYAVRVLTEHAVRAKGLSQPVAYQNILPVQPSLPSYAV